MGSKADHKLKLAFERFQTLYSESPPAALTERVLAFVESKLNPSAWTVLTKLALIHIGLALVTLSLCPQFGIRPWGGEGLGIARYFLAFGRQGCIVLCGAFFMGASVFASTWLLEREEIRVLRRYGLPKLLVISVLSLGAFLLVGAEIMMSFAVLWMVGAVMTGALVIEMNWRLRFRPGAA